MRLQFITQALSLALLASIAPQWVGEASAQDDISPSGDKTQALIDTVRSRPAGTDRDVWREERREAARQLGGIGDKRAVPVLIDVVTTEQFDSVAQIAIVALGKLGDERAIPVLQGVAADSSRDRFVRNSAKDALRKLGAKTESGASSSSSETDESSLATTGLGAASPGLASSNTTVKLAKDFGDDMLAASDQLTFAVGESHLGYDSVSGETFLDGQASASYVRIREGQNLALRYEGRGDLVAGVINFEGSDSSGRIGTLNLAGSAEARFYSGNLFGIGIGSVLLGGDYLNIKRPAADNASNTYLSGETALAIGGGYGRVLNVGERIRVQRLETVLRKHKLLGRSISPGVASEIMRAWWMMRSEVGYHDRLVATVKILRDAGALLSEPGASSSYAILQVLRDGQLNQRMSGYQAYAAVGESYLLRDEELGLQDGRVESVFSKVSYGKQAKDGESELRVDGFARLRILAEDGISSPWAVGVNTNWRDFRYSKNSDPLGAMDVGLRLGASSEGADDSKIASLVAGSLGWLFVSNRATRFRLAGEVRYESSELFAGIVFQGQYGLLDVSYVGASAPK